MSSSGLDSSNLQKPLTKLRFIIPVGDPEADALIVTVAAALLLLGRCYDRRL